MAVLPMKKALICGLKKNRKRTLEYLQRQGVLEVSRAVEDDAVFHKMDVLASKAVFGTQQTQNRLLRCLSPMSRKKRDCFPLSRGGSRCLFIHMRS